MNDKFHKDLDGMVAQFITETGKLPSKTTLFEFMEWSYGKTRKGDLDRFADFFNEWDRDTLKSIEKMKPQNGGM